MIRNIGVHIARGLVRGTQPPGPAPCAGVPWNDFRSNVAAVTHECHLDALAGTFYSGVIKETLVARDLYDPESAKEYAHLSWLSADSQRPQPGGRTPPKHNVWRRL